MSGQESLAERAAAFASAQVLADDLRAMADRAERLANNPHLTSLERIGAAHAMTDASLAQGHALTLADALRRRPTL